MWQTYALGSAFFAALTAILTKVGVKDVPSNLATAIRTLIVLLLAWSIVFVRGESGALRSLPRPSLLFLVLSGLATGLSWLCYFRALQLGPASQVAPLDKLSLPLTIVLAALFLGEKFSLQTLVGIALVGIGTYVLAK